MSNQFWVRIRSWHALSGLTAGHTLCGRRAGSDADVSDQLPSGEKSCETCLRLLARTLERTTIL